MIPPPSQTTLYDNKPINLTITDEILPNLIPTIAKNLGF